MRPSELRHWMLAMHWIQFISCQDWAQYLHLYHRCLFWYLTQFSFHCRSWFWLQQGKLPFKSRKLLLRLVHRWTTWFVMCLLGDCLLRTIRKCLRNLATLLLEHLVNSVWHVIFMPASSLWKLGRQFTSSCKIHVLIPVKHVNFLLRHNNLQEFLNNQLWKAKGVGGRFIHTALSVVVKLYTIVHCTFKGSLLSCSPCGCILFSFYHN